MTITVAEYDIKSVKEIGVCLVKLDTHLASDSVVDDSKVHNLRSLLDCESRYLECDLSQRVLGVQNFDRSHPSNR